MNLEHSFLADEARGFHTPRVSVALFRVRFRQLIAERRCPSCGGFAGTRIIHSFGARKYYGVDNLKGALIASERQLGS